jgi:arylsulfatase A-like enzyme
MPGLHRVRTRLALAACAAAFLCCGGKPGGLNVMIIAVDTLRADHLGCYGYARDTSPNIDDLATHGVLCERCVSQAPWTLPSFATVVTSLYPTQHGAYAVNTHLRTSFPTLAEILRDHGYATGAIINAPSLKPASGFDRGFDHYDMTPLNGRIADGTTRDALAWLDTVDHRPFFAFVHYFDPHLSYAPPPPFTRRFTGHYQGRIGDSFNLEGFSRVRDSMFVQMRDLTEADWAQIVALYDGEIAFTDAAIADLLKGIDERGLRDKTIIVLFSDHGEEFFEHGGFEHGHSLYDELIHVPLVFCLPGGLPENARLSRQVRLLDVAPTILDLLGIDRPSYCEGASIRPLLEGKGQIHDPGGELLPQDAAYSEALMYGREQKCVTVHPWRLVYEMGTETRHLFNLAEDPGETLDVLDEHADRGAQLEDLLFHTIFGISDTWYVEITAGDGREAFDIDVVAEKGLMPGTINPYRLLDRNGRIVEPPETLSLEASGARLRLKNLRMTGSLTLAFKVYPERVPIDFDFQINGRPALGNIFLGESLEAPATMPFTITPRRSKVKSAGRPIGEHERPYILVWYEESRYRGDTSIEIDDETKKELRALGYIQ